MSFEKLKNRIIENKKDILAALFIFALALFFFHNFLGTKTLMDNGHHLHEQSFFSYNYKYAMERGSLPFWTAFWYSGQPLFGDSQVFFLNLTHIFIILFGNIILAINLSVLIYFTIAGMGMYFLAKYLTGSRSAALISAIIYMFNGLIYGFIVAGNPSILEPYSLIPLIFLFIIKAKRSKNVVNHSIIAGILFAFQIFSGGSLMLVYTVLIIAPYLLFDLIGKNLKENLIKTVIIALTVSLAFLGLSAVKLLPNYEFIQKTNRAAGLSYQEYIGEDHFIFSDFIDVFALDKPTSSVKVHLGIIAFLLALFSLALWRKKTVMFLFALSIFALFLASGGFLAEFFYKNVPTFAQTRHIGRVLFVAAFAACVLAGYGFAYLSKLAESKFNISKKIINAGFIITAALILTELVFLKDIPKEVNIKDHLDQNELAKFLAGQNEKFRITTFDVDDLVAFYGSSYYAQYGLETLSGGGGLWINDFIRYLAIAKNQETAKLYGILNLKYATSTKEVDKAGFKLAKKFNECPSCKKNGWALWIDGPYLYENEQFMPRYYHVDNAVLVVGNGEEVQNIIYLILLNRNFDPKKTVLINGGTEINNYGIDFLKKFDAIVITGSMIDQTLLSKLKEYKNSGGKLFPDILSQENSLTLSNLEDYFASLQGSIEDAGLNSISNNEIELMPKKPGFLVLSEKFSLFDGWTARQKGKDIMILRADNVISAVYADSLGNINFKFQPKTFRTGTIISLVTLFAISFYFLFFIIKGKKLSKSSGN